MWRPLPSRASGFSEASSVYSCMWDFRHEAGDGVISVKLGLADGGWTWFGGPRVVSTETMDIFGSVRPSRSSTGSGRAEVFVGAIDRRSGTFFSEVVLGADTSEDDHNVPGLLLSRGDTLLCGHTGHHDSKFVTLSRVAVSDHGLRLLDSRQIEFPDPCTYVYLLDMREKILLLTRSIRFNWTGMWLGQDGAPLSAPFVFLPWAVDPFDSFYSGRDGNRPYLIVRKGRDGSFVFAATNDHPRAYRNGVFAGRIRANRIENLSGEVLNILGSEESWSPFEQLTEIMSAGRKFVPWIHDVAEGRDNDVYVAVSGRKKSRQDFRHGRDRVRSGYSYEIMRFANHRVNHVKTIRAGASMYSREEDYVGGIALNPLDPQHVVFSAQGFTGKKPPTESSRWQLWETRLDSEPANSRLLSRGAKELSNLRPIFSVPSTAGHHSLFFLQGSYSRYKSIQTEVARLGYEPGQSCFPFDSIHCDLPYSLGAEALFPEQERHLFESLIGESNHYLEFGSGSSTIQAFSAGVKRVTTIDSDGTVLTAISGLFPRLRKTERQVFTAVRLRAPFIGLWGYPIGARPVDFPRQYPSILAKFPPADLILIDGRCRLASFLAIVQTLKKPAIVMWDDYTSRPEYWEIESVIPPSRIVGRMAVFNLIRPVRVPRRIQRLSRKSLL